MNALLKTCLLATSLALATSMVAAQEMVHAVSGTVTAIHPKIGMLEINTDDGSSGHFQWLTKSAPSLDFDKTVRADSVSPDELSAVGAHVIVFYFGDGDVRTAVAVHKLGSTSVKEITGTVVKLNRHDRTLILKDDSGAEQTIHLDPKTVGDTSTGVEQNLKFDFDKGEPIHVTTTQTNGAQTALLIEPV